MYGCINAKWEQGREVALDKDLVLLLANGGMV